MLFFFFLRSFSDTHFLPRPLVIADLSRYSTCAAALAPLSSSLIISYLVSIISNACFRAYRTGDVSPSVALLDLF